MSLLHRFPTVNLYTSLQLTTIHSKTGHAHTYRRLLREEVTSGRLDAAPSKAAVLQQLCERLKFNPEAASALHKSLYRQKIDQILEEKKKIAGVPASTWMF